jgi:hypothetical protein
MPVLRGKVASVAGGALPQEEGGRVDGRQDEFPTAVRPVGEGRLKATSFTCPDCGRTSWNPLDVFEQYCGNCHEWFNGMRPMFYDRRRKPITMTTWSNRSMEDIRVEETFRGGGVRISTVWLGTDHSFGFAREPAIFETAIFTADDGLRIAGRYSTLASAIKGHRMIARAVARIVPFSNPRPLSCAGRVVSRKRHARKARR